MDSPLRRRSVSVLAVVLALVLVPVAAAWAYWVVSAATISGTVAATTVPAATGTSCAENGDTGVTIRWTAATPAGPAAYGYTVNLAQTAPVWTGSADAGTGLTTNLAPGSLPGSHNGPVTATVTTRYPETGGAAWTSLPSTSTTFHVKTKYFFFFFPYQALDCTP